jgi:hypothetical protein
MDPTALAHQFIETMTNAPQQATGMSIPILRPEAVASAFADVPLHGGIDMAALITSMQSDPATGAASLQAAFQQTSVNTIAALVPLVNQLVEQAVMTSAQQAVQQSHHGVLANSIVQEFQRSYPTATHPFIVNLVNGMANTVAANAPPNTDPRSLIPAIVAVIEGMGTAASFASPEAQMRANPAAQSGFSNLFGASNGR